MPVILVSGFDAWGDLSANPAWLAVEAASPQLPPDWEIQKIKLPVSWSSAFEQLRDAWTDDVEAVLCFGVAPIDGIAVERIAINLAEGSDVDGNPPPQPSVVEDGPAGYWSTLPVDTIHHALVSAGLPAKTSAHAGTYLCNALLYQVVDHALWTKPEIPAGFIHLSNLKPPGSIDQETLVQAVELSIEATLSGEGDLPQDLIKA